MLKQKSNLFYCFVAVIIIIAVLLRLFVFEFFHISGESMIPTLENGECVFAEQISVNKNSISHGDIVIVKYPDGATCVKRIIGMEGDTVEIKNGMLVLNGKKVLEKYISEKMFDEMKTITVEKGMIFVMGDNRNYSTDSRSSDIGLIPIEDIRGKVRFTVFPFDNIRTIK